MLSSLRSRVNPKRDDAPDGRLEIMIQTVLNTVVVADIGGTKIALGHLERGVPSEASSTVLTDRLRVPDPVRALETILREYTVQHGLNHLDAVVLGVPVSLDRDLDRVLSSPNIPQLENIKLGSALEARLNIPVRLERDINLLLLGEYRAGAATGASSAFGVFFGTGVGAGFLVDGKPYRGFSVGLEIGHVPIRGEGRVCVCGNVDCLEAYACGHTLNALSQEFSVPVGNLFLRRLDHPGLDRALFEFVRDQAYVTATAINLFDPEVAVIGGGIPEMRDFPRDTFLTTVTDHLRRPYPREVVRLTWAQLGSRAVLHGASAVLEERL
jgi:allose kinase